MTCRDPRWWLVLAGAGLVCGCGGTQAPVPKPLPPPATRTTDAPVASGPAPMPVRVVPAEAVLLPGDPGLQLRLERGPDDLTHSAVWTAEPQGVVTIEPGGYVRPVGTGHVRVAAAVGNTPLGAATLTVVGAAERPWDFATDIVPHFTRLGCNAGGCHGKAEGQNGFHLSLFGYDPEGDYRALTRDVGGRRVQPLDPENSLLLAKAAGRIPHGGGLRLPPGSDAYQTLLAWIRAGAPYQRGTPHGPIVAVTVDPPSILLEQPGPRQLRVLARHADGHVRDVTRLASFRTNDDSAAEVDPTGAARLLKRAETDLIVRFASSVLPVRIATPINPGLPFDFAALPRRNVIDTELLQRLEALKVPPSPPAGDAAFLRRVTLDLTGQQPLPETIREFLADTDPDKRIQLVDRLMARPEFAKFWLIKLGDLLQITRDRFPGAGHYQQWLQTRFAENAPWDDMVRELLTALGDPNRRGNGPANYAFDGPDAKTRAEQTAQRFLGIRIRCAQCHDHPFDVWTQDDYYGLAAFFAKIRLDGPPEAGAMRARPSVSIDPAGVVEHQRTRQPAMPKLLKGDLVAVAQDADPRPALAAWMTRPDNPYFARAMANWVWAQFFGKGLTEPADDLSAANPPVHPALLDALARHFVEHGYDLRDLIRTVATSHAYELSSATVPGNERDTRLFSHHLPRPLTAHQIVDAIAQATDIPNVFRRELNRKGERAIDLFDPAIPSPILDTFGRCSRRNGCAVVATPQLSLRQALLLIGGDAIDGKVASLNGYLARLLEYGAEPPDIVENLYMRTVCRPPTAEEKSHWAAELAAAASLRDAAEDLFWALLNSREFAFNH